MNRMQAQASRREHEGERNVTRGELTGVPLPTGSPEDLAKLVVAFANGHTIMVPDGRRFTLSRQDRDALKAWIVGLDEESDQAKSVRRKALEEIGTQWARVAVQ